MSRFNPALYESGNDNIQYLSPHSEQSDPYDKNPNYRPQDDDNSLFYSSSGLNFYNRISSSFSGYPNQYRHPTYSQTQANKYQTSLFSPTSHTEPQFIDSDSDLSSNYRNYTPYTTDSAHHDFTLVDRPPAAYSGYISNASSNKSNSAKRNFQYYLSCCGLLSLSSLSDKDSSNLQYYPRYFSLLKDFRFWGGVLAIVELFIFLLLPFHSYFDDFHLHASSRHLVISALFQTPYWWFRVIQATIMLARYPAHSLALVDIPTKRQELDVVVISDDFVQEIDFTGGNEEEDHLFELPTATSTTASSTTQSSTTLTTTTTNGSENGSEGNHFNATANFRGNHFNSQSNRQNPSHPHSQQQHQQQLQQQLQKDKYNNSTILNTSTCSSSSSSNSSTPSHFHSNSPDKPTKVQSNKEKERKEKKEKKEKNSNKTKFRTKSTFQWCPTTTPSSLLHYQSQPPHCVGCCGSRGFYLCCASVHPKIWYRFTRFFFCSQLLYTIGTFLFAIAAVINDKINATYQATRTIDGIQSRHAYWSSLIVALAIDIFISLKIWHLYLNRGRNYKRLVLARYANSLNFANHSAGNQ